MIRATLAFTILAFLFVTTASVCSADMIYTKDNRVYEGVIIDESNGIITIQISSGTVQLPKDAIQKVEKKPTALPTDTPTYTPKPTITRFPTSTPTATPTFTPTVSPTPTQSLDPLATLAPELTEQQADELIGKYEKVQIPKAKYVAAYYSKGVYALEDKKPATALMRWTDALRINQQLFDGPEGPSSDPAWEPAMKVRFEEALENLQTLVRKDPNVAATRNPEALQSVQMVEMMNNWIENQFNFYLALAKYYEDKSINRNLSIDNYLKAYRLLTDSRMECLQQIDGTTRSGDPFNLKRIFFVPRVEDKGRLIDRRIIGIEQRLEEKFDLQPDDYIYDYD